MNQSTDDHNPNTDQMIGSMDSALNTLEEIERMIELKKKNNASLGQLVEKLSKDSGDRL